MPANGFIGFITVQGFFIGMIFGVLKFDDAFELLSATLVITGIFYMLGQISVSYFVRTIHARVGSFPKSEHEMLLNEFTQALQRREEIVDEVDMAIVRKKQMEPQIVSRDSQVGEN